MRRALAIGLVALPVVATIVAAGGTPTGPEADAGELPQRLVDTGLYGPGRPDGIADQNRPYVPQYPLWTDGAAKARWVYLPPGTTIDVSNMDDWDFPAGTKFWKEFAFDGRRVETRLLWKVSSSRWVAGSYVWNEDGTDATLAPPQGVRGVAEVAPGRRHSIPSRADCAACHGERRTAPLGFNPLQLSTDRDPNAIHAEPLMPGMVTLATLVDERRLSPAAPGLVDHPPRIAASHPRTRTVLGYLSANCGGCHDGSDSLSVAIPSLRYPALLRDGDAVAQSLVGQPTKWQVPGRSDGTSVLIDPSAPEQSAILARMHSRRPSSQMPPLGTVVRDQEAIDLLTTWVEHDVQALAPGRPASRALTRR